MHKDSTYSKSATQPMTWKALKRAVRKTAKKAGMGRKSRDAMIIEVESFPNGDPYSDRNVYARPIRVEIHEAGSLLGLTIASETVEVGQDAARHEEEAVPTG